MFGQNPLIRREASWFQTAWALVLYGDHESQQRKHDATAVWHLPPLKHNGKTWSGTPGVYLQLCCRVLLLIRLFVKLNKNKVKHPPNLATFVCLHAQLYHCKQERLQINYKWSVRGRDTGYLGVTHLNRIMATAISRLDATMIPDTYQKWFWNGKSRLTSSLCMGPTLLATRSNIYRQIVWSVPWRATISNQIYQLCYDV